MPLPSVYSAALSEFVFVAGVKLMESERPDLMYLSTTDYIQHKAAPGTAVANEFYAMMDRHLARLDALGATIVLTADHGMNAKHGGDGSPNVIYLQDVLDGWLGKEKTARHPADHRSLCRAPRCARLVRARVPRRCRMPRRSRRAHRDAPRDRNGTDAHAGGREIRAAVDRIGDLVVVSQLDTVIGTSQARHDLSGLDVPLRSHGGLSEQKVPLIVNRGVSKVPAVRRWRNFDAFDLGLNLATRLRRRPRCRSGAVPSVPRELLRESLRIAGEKCRARARD